MHTHTAITVSPLHHLATSTATLISALVPYYYSKKNIPATKKLSNVFLTSLRVPIFLQFGNEREKIYTSRVLYTPALRGKSRKFHQPSSTIHPGQRQDTFFFVCTTCLIQWRTNWISWLHSWNARGGFASRYRMQPNVLLEVWILRSS